MYPYLGIIIFLFFVLLFFTYLALLIFAARRFRSSSDTVISKTEESVSVIVAVHNEETNVRNCLEHLLTQEYPVNLLEIIVVADRCTDATEQIVGSYVQLHPYIKMISIHQRRADFVPKKLAIDTAVRQARGNFILLTDADGRPGPGWIRSMVSAFGDDVGMVLGYAPYISDQLFNTILYRLLALEYFSHAAVAAVTTELGFPLTCVGTNLAYRKCVYEQLGGFGKYQTLLSGDDDLLLLRVRDETRWKIEYVHSSESQVWNEPPATFSQFYHQRLRYASKGFLYPFKVTLSLVSYFTLNLLLLLLPISLIWFPWQFLFIPLIFGLKIFTEYYFLKTAAVYLKDLRHLKFVPLASLLHIPYVVYFGIMAQVEKFQWGGNNS